MRNRNIYSFFITLLIKKLYSNLSTFKEFKELKEGKKKKLKCIWGCLLFYVVLSIIGTVITLFILFYSFSFLALISVGLSIWAVWLIFLKKKLAIRVNIIVMIIDLFIVPFDYYGGILPLLFALIITIVWIIYFMKSERVKNTLVK